MEKKPKISVIVPLYNAEAYIERTLNSILNQTYTNYEILLINDCPADKTIEIANTYNDKRIRMIHNVENKGIAFSRNRGIEFSNGEFIALMDHDDLALPERFAKQVAFLEQHQDIDIVGGATQWINTKDQPLMEPTIVSANPKELRAKILFYNVYWNCEVMFRRSVIESGICYHSGCYGMEDFCFWIDASVNFKMSNIPELVLQHREVETSETNRVKRMENEQKTKMFEELRAKSFMQSGYRLSGMHLNILNKILTEDKTGICQSESEEAVFLDCMKEIIKQASEMQAEYLEELKSLCKEFIKEKTGKEVIFFF